MLGNGVLHIIGSFYLGRLMPGVYTAPLLLAGSAYLLWSLRQDGRVNWCNETAPNLRRARARLAPRYCQVNHLVMQCCRYCGILHRWASLHLCFGATGSLLKSSATPVWLYFRFPLSFRDVEELMAMRGVTLSYETVREW